MAYVKIIFQNSPSTATPINAQNLNHMDDQIALNDQRLTELEGAHVSSFNGRTGAVTPADGDYDIGQIAPLSGAQVGQVPVVTNIGTEEDPELVFQMGAGGGAGGHEILDADGTSMPQESAMQFPDSHVSDDSTNGRTIVENIKEHTTASDYEQATEDGFHVIDDGNDVPIGASSEDKVEVTADGEKTYAQLLNELFTHIDVTKLTEQTVLYKGDDNFWFNLSRMESDNTLHFGSVMNYGSYFRNFAIEMNASGSKYMRLDVQGGSSNTITDSSTSKPTNGTVITLYYGTSSTVINLKTSADYCMMSDGVTSVESALSYSTTEHVVGKWIDGSDLYAKTVDLGVMPNATSKTVATGIGANAVIRHVEEIMRHTNGKYAQKIESVSSVSDITHWYFNDADFIVSSTVNISSWVGEITIFYTKTS